MGMGVGKLMLECKRVTYKEQPAPNDTNACVVVDVEEAELSVLLAQNDEDGVKHVKDLCDVVDEDPVLRVRGEVRPEGEDVRELHVL